MTRALYLLPLTIYCGSALARGGYGSSFDFGAMIAIAALFGVYAFIEFMRRKHLDFLHAAGGLLIGFAIGVPPVGWLLYTIGVSKGLATVLAVPLGIGSVLWFAKLMQPGTAAQGPAPKKPDDSSSIALGDTELLKHAAESGRTAKQNGDPENSCRLIGAYRDAWIKGYRDSATSSQQQVSETPEPFPTMTAVITTGVLLLITLALFWVAP
ncbi:hypothetical protein [Pseudomonas citronellolis]|uniref:hypothetical protein n=1 Tax=Pseudomonas citronellolis TaxID=53408 RepID=UPI0021C220C2|nr:hypothetical protein [Pseudomonas citronellolis]UXJ54878.1 hypothetical protein N5P21_11980 [Pseudomonas citronellolis]